MEKDRKGWRWEDVWGRGRRETVNSAKLRDKKSYHVKSMDSVYMRNEQSKKEIKKPPPLQ